MVNIFNSLIRFGFPCVFHEMTGFYCPGCGSTRSARFLIRGDLGRSFIYNPIVPYTIFFYYFIFYIIIVFYFFHFCSKV